MFNLALLLFLIYQTASTSQPTLKRFIEPSDIENANRPFSEDVLYVDKTSHILNLFQSGKRYFFVRPRRFGKSTFLQTLKKVFEGRSDVFNGTSIHQSKYSWEKYPVLYMDFGRTEDTDCASVMHKGHSTLLVRKLEKILAAFKAKYTLSCVTEPNVIFEFASILTEMKEQTGKRVVVLVDEYDYPVLANMKHCPAASEINERYLSCFLSQLKTEAGCIQFAFVTEISKSIFSTVGSSFDLIDITANEDFHDIAGLTESELKEYCDEYITKTSNHLGKPRNNITDELRDWYDGYKFSPTVPYSLYNPLSVHSYFTNKYAIGYWSDKRHARFLLDQMVKRPEAFSNLNIVDGVESRLRDGQSLDTADPILLLYDAGYLTIRGLAKGGRYTLGFPNREMESSFYTDIAEAATESESGTTEEIGKIRIALTDPEPDFDAFIDAINIGMKKLGMRAPFEEWYDWQTMLFMQAAGVKAERQNEIQIDSGRSDKKTKIVDVTGYTLNTYFLFEIKFNRKGCGEAWKDAKQSIKAHLNRNKREKNPLNLLAAGFTFTPDIMKNPVSAYKAKLFAPNGTVLRKYSSSKVTHDSNSDESVEVHGQ